VTEIVAVDIGGTHARFALAEIAEGRVVSLGEVCTLKTSEYPGIEAAWEEFARRAGRPLPPAAAIAVAGPVHGATFKLTNSDWVIDTADIRSRLGVQRYRLTNDFGAVTYAVANLDVRDFRHLCGPARPLPDEGVVSIIGPGTGLGVAQLVRRGGRSHVVETEGGHVGFAPLDPLEDRILAGLRGRFGRVSVERIVSGPGLANLYQALSAIEGQPTRYEDQKELWDAALAGEDGRATAALDRFCLSLGSVAGDIALAHGADAVVIAGGLGLKLADRLPASSFEGRFVAKGRFEARMKAIPVKLLTHPEPGLFGAAAAFAKEHGE
jgi:glucokinase